MATQLIKHLEDCAKSDAIYKPLESQWTFDERLIAKALQNVGVYFPHYSRHDESHSRQILVHIERLLGPDNIAKLSPTDTWLLLEAAYLHDIGMIISDDQLKEDYDAIKEHVKKVRYSANGDVLTVMNALLASKEKTASSIFASVDISPFQAIKLLREIIADFYRAQHPDRADKIIPNPFDEIGLNSPRNELLPARFFSLLGKICAYHGDSFDKVMELPKQQVGIGTDDCHPRFIACLLRLGDLLDLDDNRFCPVMMKVAGKLPELSEAHRQKHLAIRHFRADPDRIEIEAECPDYESYIETTKWFGWLRDEVKNQMSRWFDIVPERSFGLLPSVGDLKAHLKDWQVFSENQRPHFELDRDRIFELLQGAGLYECKEQAMRELLQNAVDATLIRIWREHGEECKPHPESFIKCDSAPRSEEVQNILSRYPIDVSIEKEKEEEQHNYWRITIADQGTGISRDDLKFMLQMGSSKKNHRKRAIIEKMPVWMKPSGIFGIGLHSVFLLTDEVLIETRSIDTGETLVIRMTNPTDSQEYGNVYFQIITKPTTIELNSPGSKKISREFKPWNFSHYGCRLSFIYKTDKTTDPKHEYKTGSLTAQYLQEQYDGLIRSREDLDIIKIKDESSSFFTHCLLNGKLIFNKEAIKSIKKESDNVQEKNAYYYAVGEQLTLIIYPNNLCYRNCPKKTVFRYRGQEVNEQLDFFNFFNIEIDLLDDEADKILTINRNYFRSDTNIKEKLFNRASNAIQKFFKSKDGKSFYEGLNENYKQLMKKRKDDFFFSLLENTDGIIEAEYKLQGWQRPKYFNSDWRRLSIRTDKGIKKIEELKNYDTILCFDDAESEYRDCTPLELLLKTHSGANTIEIDRYTPSIGIKPEYRLIHKFLKDNDFKAETLIDGRFEIVKISKEQKQPISDDVIISYCKNTIIEGGYYSDSLKRRTIPCLSDYLLLALDNPNRLPILINENSYDQINPSFDLDLISPRMLFPLARINEINGDENKYKITVGNLNILAERVYKNRADKNTTKEQIEQKYQKFIAFLDDLMKDDEKWKQLRGSEFDSAPTDNHSHGG